MGVLDFLFGGTAPPNAPATGGTRNIPRWLSDASMNMVAKTNAVANMPYVPYQGPRLASAGQDQQSSYDVVRNQAGAYTPAAIGALQQTQGITGAVQPAYDAAGSAIQGGMGTYTGNNISQYMNPYVGNVIDRATTLANRNFNENILPQLNAQFIGSGQYGSLGHEAEAFRGARGVSDDLQQQALSALDTAYTSGANIFGQDQSRALQGGSELGALAGNYGNLALNAAGQQSNQAGALQSMGLKDAAALDTIGQEQQNQTQRSLDLAYQDFMNQRDYQKNQLQWQSGIMNGLPAQSGTSTSIAPAESYGPSPLATAASIFTGIQGMNAGSARGGLIRGYADGGSVSPLAAVAGNQQQYDIPQWLKELIATVMMGQHPPTDAAKPSAQQTVGADEALPKPRTSGGESTGNFSSVLAQAIPALISAYQNR